MGRDTDVTGFFAKYCGLNARSLRPGAAAGYDVQIVGLHCETICHG